PLVRDCSVFLVVDIVGQFLIVVAELGMQIDLARLPVEIGFILAHAAAAHEFERELQVQKADGHHATSRYLMDDVERGAPASSVDSVPRWTPTSDLQSKELEFPFPRSR